MNIKNFLSLMFTFYLTTLSSTWASSQDLERLIAQRKANDISFKQEIPNVGEDGFKRLMKKENKRREQEISSEPTITFPSNPKSTNYEAADFSPKIDIDNISQSVCALYYKDIFLGNGFLYSNDIVVTALHNIPLDFIDEMKEISIYFPAYQCTTTFNSYEFAPDRIDLAYLALNEAVHPPILLQILEEKLEGQSLIGMHTIIYYDDSSRKIESKQFNQSITQESSFILTPTHNIPTEEGFSGSPIINYNSQVIGMHLGTYHGNNLDKCFLPSFVLDGQEAWWIEYLQKGAPQVDPEHRKWILEDFKDTSNHPGHKIYETLPNHSNHHIIPRANLKYLWAYVNAMNDPKYQFVTGKDAKKSRIAAMTEYRLHFINLLKNLSFEHQKNLEGFIWAPWNLFKGPSNRSDDPKNDHNQQFWEKNKPISFDNELWNHISKLNNIIKILKRSKIDKLDDHNHLSQTLNDLFSYWVKLKIKGIYPKEYNETDWEKKSGSFNVKRI